MGECSSVDPSPVSSSQVDSSAGECSPVDSSAGESSEKLTPQFEEEFSKQEKSPQIYEEEVSNNLTDQNTPEAENIKISNKETEKTVLETCQNTPQDSSCNLSDDVAKTSDFSQRQPYTNYENESANNDNDKNVSKEDPSPDKKEHLSDNVNQSTEISFNDSLSPESSNKHPVENKMQNEKSDAVEKNQQPATEDNQSNESVD